MVSTEQQPLICGFDQTPHATLEDLHIYIRRFKISREKYYHEYHPRRDPITNDLIPFKDYEQYFSQDFTNKLTLKKWLKQNPTEGWKWAKGWLMNRKAAKRLIYAPSQVELKTCTCPSIPYYESLGVNEGGYYGVTTTIGFTPRYTTEPLIFNSFAANAVVITDTREQDAIKLSCASRVDTLNVGDYALASPHDVGIRIERKSLSDFCGTLTTRPIIDPKTKKPTGQTPLKRFDAELARAQAAGLYVIMMVESSIDDAQRFNYLPQTQWVKASPSFIFHNLRDLLIKYPLTFQVVFVDGRVEMAQKIIRVLQLGQQVRTTDLEWVYERGDL